MRLLCRGINLIRGAVYFSSYFIVVIDGMVVNLALLFYRYNSVVCSGCLKLQEVAAVPASSMRCHAEVMFGLCPLRKLLWFIFLGKQGRVCAFSAY